MNRSNFFIGRWGVRPEQLVHARGKRWHLDSEAHDAPAVIFATGEMPEQGDPVVIFVTADTCLQRGWGNHRRRTKIVLRVKPYVGELLPHNGTLEIVELDPGTDKVFRLAGGFWLVSDAGEPLAKYHPDVDPPEVWIDQEQLDALA